MIARIHRSETADAELSAREVLQLELGHSITDAEWQRIRTKLIEFATSLRTWDQPANSSSIDLGNV